MTWEALPAAAQDAVVLALGLGPLPLVAAILLRGHWPAPVALALVRRHPGVSATFVLFVALSLAVGSGLLAQERGLRAASARVTDPFDVVVAAPGSETTALLAALFLQPADMGLVSSPDVAAIRADPRAALAAPVAFGDTVGAAPVVGTVPELLPHLGPLAEGRSWTARDDAVVGARVPHAPGDALVPAHGLGEAADGAAHDSHALRVVGRLASTGTPWDDAVLVPIESVWAAHGLLDENGTPGRADGPGAPAVLVRATSLGAAYAFRADWQREGRTMAFLPGAELARLHALMGDVRAAMGLMALAALGLVGAAVLAGLVLVARLFRRHLALMAALGAPRRFLVAVLWLHATAHLALGALLGLPLGLLGAALLSRLIAGRTGLAVEAGLGVAELRVAAIFLGLAGLAALLPALLAPPREPARALR